MLKKEIAEEKNRNKQAGREGQEAREKLVEIIRQQFQHWQLTGSEQASAIYKKAGVNGRHAFSAWFIEDFL